MTANILTGGVDIDTKFLARVSAKIADVGFKVAGVDISNRYEARGSSTAIANTNLKAGGVDIATLFRDINVPLGTAFTVVAGTGTIITTTLIGWNFFLSVGSISPAQFAGVDVQQAADQHDTGVDYFVVTLQGTRAQTFFTSVTINGHTYNTASATTFDNSSGTQTTWGWSTSAGLVNAGSYPMTMS